MKIETKKYLKATLLVILYYIGISWFVNRFALWLISLTFDVSQKFYIPIEYLYFSIPCLLIAIYLTYRWRQWLKEKEE